MADDLLNPELRSAVDARYSRPFPELQVVATGITLIYVSLVLYMLMIVGGIAIALSFRGPQPMPAAFGWVGIGIHVLSIVGTLLCLWTPPKSGATNWLYGSVFFELIAASISLARAVIDELSPTIESVQQPAYAISSIFFVLFLRSLALHVGAPQVARRAQRTLIAGVILCVLLLIYFTLGSPFLNEVRQVGKGQAQEALREMLGIVLLILALSLSILVVAVYVVIKYVGLLNSLRKIIRGKLLPE